MKKLVTILALSLFFVTPILAGDSQEVETIVKTKVDIILTLMNNKKLTKETRDQQLLNTLRPVIDFNLVAKLSLGSKNRQKLNKEQYKKFNQLFVTQLEDSLLEKLYLYTDETVQYTPPKPIGKKRIQMLVNLISKDDVIALLFKFYQNKKKKWMTYDLEILGVSVVQTYRSQFGNALKTGSAEQLLEKMSKRGEFKIPEGQKPAKKNS